MEIAKKTPSDWANLLASNKVLKRLINIYGTNRELIQERINSFLIVLNKFKEIYGEKEVSFVRTPGRLNLLGMHVDHRGSFINTISIQKETILCFTPSEDDKIQVYNLKPDYGKRDFKIKDELSDTTVNTEEDWLSLTQKLTNKRILNNTNTDWTNKLKAVPVYLKQVLFKNKSIRGINGVLDSNIPARVGLSSSSTLIVAMMDVLLYINNLSIEDNKFAHHCGVAEWYVGTRGGFGDHAAIKFGRPGMITHMKTVPVFHIESYLLFPKDYSIIIFHSGIEADKTGSAGQKFNEKVATYEIGEIFIKKYIRENYPSVFSKIKKLYLADLLEHFPDSEIYKIIKSLPYALNRREILIKLKNEKETLQKIFATHKEPKDKYKISPTILYGISECTRGKIISDFLKKGDIHKFGELMNISHDGDRVSNIPANVKEIKKSIKSNIPMYMHPGDYNCSIKEIDEMIDIAKKHGAIGAQISGAGLGGSIMVLVKKEKVNNLIKRMEELYYKPRKLSENYINVVPIKGSGIL